MNCESSAEGWEQVIDTKNVVIDKKTRRDIRIAERENYIIKKVLTIEDWNLIMKEQTMYAYENLKKKVFDSNPITKLQCLLKVIRGRQNLLKERTKDYEFYRNNNYVAYLIYQGNMIRGGIVIKIDGDRGTLCKLFSDRENTGVAALLIREVCKAESEHIKSLSMNVGINADKHLLKKDGISHIIRFKQHFGTKAEPEVIR